MKKATKTTLEEEFEQAEPYVNADAGDGVPEGFRVDASGVHWLSDGTSAAWTWICSPLHVRAVTRDENSENWGRLVTWIDPDEKEHRWAMPMDLLRGDCADLRGYLLNRGVQIATSNQARLKLAGYLQDCKPAPRATCATRTGWYGGRFILPGGSYPDDTEVLLQSDNANHLTYRVAGTLEEWQEKVALPCRNNSRLMLGLCCAFAAPLLEVTGRESGGFNLLGQSSVGKSTALAVAGSVWGGGGINGFIKSWRSTSNALEAMAEAHNDALLPLDELGQLDSKEAGEVTYMLANGTGKNRSRSGGGLRRAYEWRTLFLSTGEMSITDKMRETGKKVPAGVAVRVADVPADAGKGLRLFDTLNGFVDGAALSQHLRDHAGRYYGSAIRAYLPHVAAVRDRISGTIETLRADFFKQFVPKDADGQVERVADRFVLLAAAGELAIEVGVLPFGEQEAFDAIGLCFTAWLGERGYTGSQEIEQGLRQVRAFFEQHGASRFEKMKGSGDEKVMNRAGFKDGDDEGEFGYYVLPEIFKNEVTKGLNASLISAALVERGALITSNSDERGYQTVKRLPGLGSKRVYHISSKVFDLGDA